MAWTDERVELLKKYWAQGLSATQIAKELGGVTRNAVIGKVHRLGLSGRATPSSPKRLDLAPARLRPSLDSRALRTPGFDEADREAIEKLRPITADMDGAPCEDGATVLTLSKQTCKWPIGDPDSEDFHFCGHRPQTGSPYCLEHAKQAFQPSRKRERRRASVEEELEKISRRLRV